MAQALGLHARTRLTNCSPRVDAFAKTTKASSLDATILPEIAGRNRGLAFAFAPAQMMTPLRLLAAASLAACAAGCQHPRCAPPPVSSAPPTLTSSPVPPSEHPAHAAPRDEPVWRFDFVLTPKDPKDATLAPTAFTFNVVERRGGEVMIGHNVPLQTATPPPPGPPAPRQDVGLKVKTHVEPLAADRLLLDVELELSAVEGGNPASIRKVSAHGSAVAAPGKSALVVSLDDDKRHYELTVTPTKLH
jgi:hypothetical protein